MSVFSKKTSLEPSELFAALDIGSSKVCCAIAKLQARSNETEGDVPLLRVLGVGYQVSRGLKNGSIVDLEALEDSIVNAVHSAEQSAGETINQVYVNIPTGLTQSHRLTSEIYLSNTPIDQTHLQRLLNINPTSSIGNDRYVLHVLPITYDLDDIKDIRDPKGMVGEKLSVHLHVISAPLALVRNLGSCIGRCHLDIAGLVVGPYASALATLVDDEMELGATVIDVGGGSTTIACFYEGNLVYMDHLPIGGTNITNDIARGLSAPIAQAERLKTLYGTLIQSSSDDRENILVPQVGEEHNHVQHIPKSLLTHIIRSRMEEIFELITQRLKEVDIDSVVFQKIVLTGGASQLQGMREMAQVYLGRQVRVGAPNGFVGSQDVVSSPIFSTCAGLLQYSLQDHDSKQISRMNKLKGSLWQRINAWLKENF